VGRAYGRLGEGGKMAQPTAAEQTAVQHRAQLPVQCPVCHWRQFIEVSLDKSLLDTPYGREMQQHIQEWLRSRCPEHLGPIMETLKN
jgi:hypothetical protein